VKFLLKRVVFSLDPGYVLQVCFNTGRAGSLCLALELEFLQKKLGIGDRWTHHCCSDCHEPLGLLVDFDGACFQIICSVSASEVLSGDSACASIDTFFQTKMILRSWVCWRWIITCCLLLRASISSRLGEMSLRRAALVASTVYT
jgi:hypothetical protein